MALMTIRRDGWRMRTYVLGGRRLHHGTLGTALIALGITLAWHDRHDIFEWYAFLREKDEIW